MVTYTMPAPLLGWLVAGLLLFGLTGSVIAESTDITVRVIARNAMFVGDLVEGAQVTVSDAVTGEMLAQGVTAGHAGDAKRIMGTARKRGTLSSQCADVRSSRALTGTPTATRWRRS